MELRDQVWVGNTARALFDALKRPASAREFANIWGVEKAEAERWLRMAVKARVVVHFDRWVVRGYLIQGAWGPAEVRSLIAEKKKLRVLEWVRANGPVKATYQQIADDVGLGAGDCHSVCQALAKAGRIYVRGGVFEAADEGSEVAGRRRTG